jgi:hypothetical protein
MIEALIVLTVIGALGGPVAVYKICMGRYPCLNLDNINNRNTNVVAIEG